MRAGGRFVAFAAMGLGLAARPAIGHAQRCDAVERTPASSATTWSGPLTRAVSLRAEGIALGDALERAAGAAGIRLSYSGEALPLDRRVCRAWSLVPVGDVLVELLAGVSVRPVVAGSDLVVLAPASSPLREVTEPEPSRVYPLDPVVVTASSTSAGQRTTPFSLEVLDGREIAQTSEGTLGGALNAGVPGMWVWPGSGSNVVAQYGSIRGASSFGLSAPKVYIDGIEVANPLLITRISPEAIDRIEVIRGPQGAAMFGADAINGVTNIITRSGSGRMGSPRTRLRSGMGLSSSAFTQHAALAQDHALSMVAGSDTRSIGVNVAIGTIGEHVPGAYSTYGGADGSIRFVGSRSVVSGTVRFFAERAGTPSNPLLADSLVTYSTSTPSGPAAALSMQQFTAGMNATFAANDRWTHTLVIGVDGYTLDGVSDAGQLYASAADSALRAAGSAALRGTLRLSSVARLADTERASAALTLSAEHSMFRQRGGFDAIGPYAGGGSIPAGAIPPAEPAETGNAVESPGQLGIAHGSSGLGAHIAAEWLDRIFVSGGIRVERDAGFGDVGRLVTLPMLGGAFVTGFGNVDVKLRAAYGKGIRWPQLPTHEDMWNQLHARATRLDLGPETQTGIEAGLDVSVGRSLSLRVTRFDQTASGLIQRVAVEAGAPDRFIWELQSVGEIANRGWEFQGSVRRGPLTLGGAMSFVDSRVSRLADDYYGDLRTGDRMLAVPARTASISAAWNAAAWSASLTATRAADWVNYDRIALARSVSVVDGTGAPTGTMLREYWRSYPGITHLGITLSRDLRSGFAVMLSGRNLLNLQVGEPDNITVMPGRTITIGLRASF